MFSIAVIALVMVACIIGLAWVVYSSYHRHTRNTAYWKDFVKAHNLVKSLTIICEGTVVDAGRIVVPAHNFGLYEFSSRELNTLTKDIEYAAQRVIKKTYNYYYIVRLDHSALKRRIEKCLDDNYEDIKAAEEVWNAPLSDLFDYVNSWEEDITTRREWHNYTFGCKISITREMWEQYKSTYASEIISPEDLPRVQLMISPLSERSEFQILSGEKAKDSEDEEVEEGINSLKDSGKEALALYGYDPMDSEREDARCSEGTKDCDEDSKDMKKDL